MTEAPKWVWAIQSIAILEVGESRRIRNSQAMRNTAEHCNKQRFNFKFNVNNFKFNVNKEGIPEDFCVTWKTGQV